MGLRRLVGMRPRTRQRAARDIDTMVAEGDLDRAEEQLRARVQANPNSLGYRVKLADLFARNKKPTKAALEYTAVAEAHAAKEAYDPAIRLVERALDLAPGNLDITERLVRLERLRRAQSKRSVIFDYLERGVRPTAATRALTSSGLLKFWPEIVSCALVQDLPAEQLGAFFGAVEPIQVSQQAAVMRQGQIIARGHLIACGAIEATLSGPDGRQLRLDVLKPGDLFGEASLLDNAPCPADYRALGDGTTVLRMNKRALDALRASEPGADELVEAFREFGCDGRVYAAAQALTNH